MSLKDLKKRIRKHFAKNKEKGEDLISFLELKDREMRNKKGLDRKSKEKYLKLKRKFEKTW